MTRRLPGADAHPRIHIWPQREGFAWSIGPRGVHRDAPSPGAGVDAALMELAGQADSGAVVILEESGR